MTDADRIKEITEFGQKVCDFLTSQAADADSVIFSNILDGAVLALLTFAGNHATEGKRSVMLDYVETQFNHNLGFVRGQIVSGGLPS
jgi:hypothetical protein